MKYTLELENKFPIEMYYVHSTQYSKEELFMSAITAKELIKKEVSNFFDADLDIEVKIAEDSCEAYFVVVSYKTKDLYIAREHKKTSCRDIVMYGKDNASKISCSLGEFTSYYEPLMLYMLIFNFEDIADKYKDLFSRICITDNNTNKFIEIFRKEHKHERQDICEQPALQE